MRAEQEDAGAGRAEPSRREVLAPAVDWSTEQLATSVILVVACLRMLGAALQLDQHRGVETFLGLLSSGEASEMLEVWRASHRPSVLWLYLMLDSVAFVPLYTSLLLRVIAAVLSPRRVREAAGLRVLALALALNDLIENATGLVRSQSWFALILAGSVALWGGACWLRWLVPRARWARSDAACIAVVAAWLVLLQGLGVCESSGGGIVVSTGCLAHYAKAPFAVLAVGLQLVASSVWLLGVGVPRNGGGRERAALRTAIGDCLGRSRYVLLILVLLVGLLRMDQARDVLYAMAAWPLQSVQGRGERAALYVGSAISFGALLLSMWLLVFTCWLWTRTVCELKPAPRQPDGDSRPANAPVSEPCGLQDEFARYWARALAFVPALAFAWLSARVIEDTVISVRRDSWVWTLPLIQLFSFGLLSALLGAGFVRGRARSQQERYYSSLPWSGLGSKIALWGGGGSGAVDDRARQYRVGGGLKPYWLPLALGLSLLLMRFVDSLPPSSQKVDGIPTLALAIVCVSLALWLCFLGWLSLLEVRQAIPWIGILVGIVGLFGWCGWTDNHVVRYAMEDAQSSDGRALQRMLA